MRFIELTSKEKETLEQAFQRADKAYLRNRCQAILLSHRRYKVGSIAALFETRTHTIRSWFDQWQAQGLAGLTIKPGRGRKAAIDFTQEPLVEDIKQQVKLNAQDLDQVSNFINQKWGLSLSKGQVKTFLKKN